MPAARSAASLRGRRADRRADGLGVVGGVHRGPAPHAATAQGHAARARHAVRAPRTGPGQVYGTRDEAAEAFVPILAAELRGLATRAPTASRSTSRRRRSIRMPPPTSPALFNAAIEPVRRRVRLGAHLCFGNFLGRPLAPRSYRPILDAMLGFGVDELVLEFANREMSEVDLLGEIAAAGRDVAAGVVDVKNYHLESADEVADRDRGHPRGRRPAGAADARPDCGFSQTARCSPPPSSARSSRAGISSSAASDLRQPSRRRRSAMESHRISMLGTGLIGDFYTATLHGQRGRDRVQVVYSERRAGAAFQSAGTSPRRRPT